MSAPTPESLDEPRGASFNPLSLLGFRPSELAERLLPVKSLLCVVWGSLFVSGCFIVTDPIYLDAFPNRPPRIVEESAQPARSVTVPALPNCSISFRAQAEDLDTNDTLIARWYIDYDSLNNSAPFSESELAPIGTSPDNGPRPRAPALLTIRLDSANNPLPVGDHVVEVLVADGTLINRTPAPRPPIGTFPDGGSITDVSYAVSYAWFVNVTDEGTACP